jgi:hypothetical protein
MKAYWGCGCIAPRILELGIRWRWVVSLTPRRFSSREDSPGTHWIGAWVGPRAGLVAMVNNTQHYHDSNHRSSSTWPSAIPLSYSGSYLGKISTLKLNVVYYYVRYPSSPKSRNSSVAIATGLRARRSGFCGSIPGGSWEFCLHHCVQNGSGAHQASYPTGTREFFPGVKAAGTWSWQLTSI